VPYNTVPLPYTSAKLISLHRGLSIQSAPPFIVICHLLSEYSEVGYKRLGSAIARPLSHSYGAIARNSLYP